MLNTNEEFNSKIEHVLNTFFEFQLLNIDRVLQRLPDEVEDFLKFHPGILENPITLKVLELRDLLKQLGGPNSFNVNMSNMLIYSLKTHTSITQAEAVDEVIRLWIEKGGMRNYKEAEKDNILEDILTDEDFKDEGIRFIMLKALLEKEKISFREEIWVRSVEEFKPILWIVLRGFASKGHILAPNLKVLDYMLERGSAADLYISMEVLYYPYGYGACLKVPELAAIWEIVKADYKQRGKEITQADGEKIAKFYLYCKENNITANWLRHNIDTVIESFNSSIGLKDLLANCAKNVELNDNLWKALETEAEPLVLAKIKRLLIEGKVIEYPTFYPPYGDRGDNFLQKLITKVGVYHTGELEEIAKLWAEKRGKSNCQIALEYIFRQFPKGKEAARAEVIKGLVSIVGVRPQVFSLRENKTLPIVSAVLVELTWQPIDDNEDITSDYYNYCHPDASMIAINTELLKYLLAKGAGADLIPGMEMIYESSGLRYSLTLKDTELLRLWDIVKEERRKNGHEITPEESEKIAKIYLLCKEKNYSADWINQNKAWVLSIIHSPFSLKDLAASAVKNCLKKEADIAELLLPPILKTSIENAKVSALEPGEEKSKQKYN